MWEERKIGQLCHSIFSGGTPSTNNQEYWDGDFYWLSSGETRSRYIYKTEKTITREGIENSSTRLASRGDVVMACAGQGKTRGQTSLLKTDMYINQSVVAFKTKSEMLMSTFLFYNLTQRYGELRALSDASSTRGSITTEMLKNLSITVPSLPTQQKISDVLSAYDDHIDNNNRRIKLLEKAAQEFYKEWFVRFRFPGYETSHFTKGIPDGWDVKCITELSDITDGTHDSPKPVEKGYYLVTGKNIVNDAIDFSTAYYISEKDHISISKRSGLEKGNILFSNIGTIGSTCIIGNHNDFSVKNVIIVKPFTKEGTYFLYCLLKNNTTQEIFNQQASGSSQQFIALGFIRRYKILMPDSNLLNKFTDQAEPILEKRAVLQEQNQNLIIQRDLLLPRLMSGKIEV